MGYQGIGSILIVPYCALITDLTIFTIHFIAFATRFVKAHQRGAEALESVARALGNQRES